MKIDYKNPDDYWLCHADYDQYDDNGCLAPTCYAAILIIFILACVFLAGCSPKVIENTIVQHDTCYVEKYRRDSIWQHDSIYVHEYSKGDTVYRDRDRWITKYKEMFIRDTAYISRTDTITQTKIQQVKKTLSGWQWFQIWAGRLVLIALTLAAVVWGVRRWLRVKLP